MMIHLQIAIKLYGQYEGNQSYTPVATGTHARGQYSTGLLGTCVQTHMAYTSTHTHV